MLLNFEKVFQLPVPSFVSHNGRMEEQALLLPYSHNTDVGNTIFEVFTVVCIYIMFWDTNRLVENCHNTVHHNLLVENPP
jgi:hypothetical protein